MLQNVAVKKVFVGMSGGVDSSVATALLKERGFAVTGVFLKPWQPEGVRCLWEQDRADALRVASHLGIPFETWDVAEAYGEKVGRVMLDAYARGETPNPDVLCNQEIKFGIFYDQARARGADVVATGHYARIVEKNGAFALCAGIDRNKDQSYFLWTLRGDQLPHILFPVGDMEKPQVRAHAEQLGLITHDKKDSQGVCFIGAFDMHDFLKKHITTQSGPIVDESGTRIGTHDGAQLYTIGQRHGLALGGKEAPLYVIAKDVATNTLTVGSKSDLHVSRIRITHMHWIGEAQKTPLSCDVRIRYRAPVTPCTLSQDGECVFTESQKGVAVGQSAVFYDGDRVLGGGIISEVFR